MIVLYTIDQFFIHGGIEKILAAKINSLVQDYGFTVHLITSGQSNRHFVYDLDPKVIHKDLKIDYIETGGFFSKTNLKKKIKHAKMLKGEIDKIAPDIIVSPAFSHDQYFLPFIKKNIPKIKEVHFSGVILPVKISKPSALSIVRWFYKFYDRVVILNEDEKKYFPGLKLSVIPNFVDCKNKRLAENAEREKTVITAGRIAPVKQFEHLLKAWAQVGKNNPDWKLKVYGDGDQMYVSHLKTLSVDLGVINVEFPGPVNNLSEIMQCSSIFVLSSANECFPMVLLEAKCAGLPAVSYDSPNGPRNIIKNKEDGILVKYNSPQKLAEALEKLIMDTELRLQMSKHAHNNAVEFSKDEIMKLWVKLFKQVSPKSV